MSRRRRASEGDVADLLGLLGPPLRAGVNPATALRAARACLPAHGALGPLVDELVAAAGRGVPLADVWLEGARGLDHPGLHFVGSAWSVSEVTGAPLADALACAESVLRERSRSAERLRVAVAGPRASMTVLTLLPVAGPLVGLACGVSPVELYLSHPAATSSLVLGLVWVSGARAWAARILRGAS